jgi:hypothetical protein
MPAAPRVKNKATRIAYKVMGEPINIKDKKTKTQKRIDHRLLFENTSRVR